MSLRLLGAALAALLPVPAAPALPPAIMPTVVQDDVPGISYGAVALILCGSASGTAFWISPERIITADHVIANGPCTINGTPVTVVRTDRNLDIAELRGIIGTASFPVRCGGFKANRAYVSIGWARGRYLLTLPQITTGNRSYNYGSHGLRIMVGEAIPGMSGGPVLDEQNRVVGIVNRHSPSRSRDLADTWICE